MFRAVSPPAFGGPRWNFLERFLFHCRTVAEIGAAAGPSPSRALRTICPARTARAVAPGADKSASVAECGRPLLPPRSTRLPPVLHCVRPAMGQDVSSEAPLDGEPSDGDNDALGAGIDVQTLSGYRCMKVFKGSPAVRAGLAAFEDFILAVDGVLVGGDGALGGTLQAAEGNVVELTVWNCIDAKERCVTLTPAKWTGGPGLLGAAVRYEPVRGAADFVWRVLDVFRNSPADDAGLVPKSDYIVGTTAEVFRTSEALSKLIAEAARANVAASVLVYSTSTARTRCVEIIPAAGWGGEGVLGCELATGLLHRLTREGGQ
jgi:hypothetical protein